MKSSTPPTLRHLKTNSTSFFAQLAKVVAPYPVPFAHTLRSNDDTATLSLFAVIVAIMITTQTTDQVSERAFRQLMTAAGGVKASDLLTLSMKEIEQALREVNYYRTKATRIRHIAKRIDNLTDKEVIDKTFLLSLPGIGPKVANLVRGIWGEDGGIAVDTHLLRIFYRLGVTQSATNATKAEQELATLFLPQQWVALNDYGVRFGQHVCTARHPHCNACPFNHHCPKRGVSIDG